MLLHSSASSSQQWQALIETLRLRFCVHAVDLHGHGARPAWRGPTSFSLADDAAPVAPLLAQAGSVHLVGHPYGTAVALKLASLHPARVRSVIVYEPALLRCLLDDPAHRRQARQIATLAAASREQLTRGRADKAARQFVDFWSGAGAWQTMPLDCWQAPRPSPDPRHPLRAGGALHLKSPSAGMKHRCNRRPRPCNHFDSERTEDEMKHRTLNEQLTAAALAALAVVSWLLITIIAPSASFI